MNLRFLWKKLLPVVLPALLAACASSNSGSVPAGYYRVQSGDTLYRISKRFGQNVSTIAAWNNIRDTSQISVGQVLRVRRNVSVSDRHARVVSPTNRVQLQWPVSNGRNNILAKYNGHSNKGVDIGGTRGEAVKAAAAGKVLYVGQAVRGYGNLVLVSHTSSLLTAYANNDSVLVQKGDLVRAGQTIATLGSTDANQVKLHFEVRVNGKAVNPMPYLK